MIFKAEGMKKFLKCDDDDVREFLEIPLDEPISNHIERLRNKLADLEKKQISCNLTKLERNLTMVQKSLGLNETEKTILRFVIFLKCYGVIDDVVRLMGVLSDRQTIKALSRILNLNYEDISEALSRTKTLHQSSLVKLEQGTGGMCNKLEILSRGFANEMLNTEHKNIDEMFVSTLKSCNDSKLTIKNYTHIKDDVKIMISFLKKVVRKKQRGVNILLYGSAGTGKTELSKIIARELNLKLVEVAYGENEGCVDETKRIKYYCLAQNILSPETSILMYDEAEDLFNMKNEEQRQYGKAFINRALESNRVPTIWITNNIYTIDVAVVRRFNMALEVGIPNESERAKIIKEYSANLIDNETIERLAKNRFIAPAIVSNASMIVSNLNTAPKDKAFERIISNTLKAQGYGEIESKGSVDELPYNYDPDFIRSDCDLNELVKGIKKSKSARICIYGVPGTGKSAYAKFIAKILKKPIIIKKGSDLIDCYVGSTEKNIAMAFKEAKNKKAVLVFDEVDSFLQDRNSASRSWEITQVNEMLVQMESFDGIFIATTNLIDNLDKASLRRFDLKLEFGYLLPNQALNLFKKECALLKVKFDENAAKKVSNLGLLAPGDFASVRRQSNFRPIKDCEDFCKRLEQEISLKNDYVCSKIGF
jgi:ATPase of the AAA+ class